MEQNADEKTRSGRRTTVTQRALAAVMFAVMYWFSPLPPAAQAADFNATNSSSVSTATPDEKTIHIGYLADTETQPPERWSTVQHAIDQAQSDGLLTGYNFELHANTTTCDSKSGTFNALYMFGEQNVDVLFGPTCSLACTASGYIASYYSAPYFPEWCRDSLMDNSTTFNTLIRVAGSWTSLGLAVKSVMNYYGWDRLVLLSDTVDDTCYYGATSINGVLSTTTSDGDAANVYWIRMASQPADSDIDAYLKDVSLHSRIVIFCHSDKSVMQRLLFKAQDNNMTSGDYAFFIFGDVSLVWAFQPDDLFNLTDVIDREYRLRAFAAVKQIVIDDFDMVFNESLYNNTEVTQASSVFSKYLHDAVYLYISVADKLFRQGLDFTDGSLILKAILNTTYEGESGTVYIGPDGDRVTSYAVLAYDYVNRVYYKYMSIIRLSFNQTISVIGPAKWGFSDKLPTDTPACGFRNELCVPVKPGSVTDIAIAVSVVIIVLLVIGKVFQVYRTKSAEARIKKMLWQVKFDEMTIFQPNERSVSVAGTVYTDEHALMSAKNEHAVYKGAMLALELLDKTNVKLNRRDLIELYNRKELSHDNIRPFVGVCMDPRKSCFLAQCCSRGTLQNLIKNDDIKLDDFFRTSLLFDLANGMQYLHKSVFQSHGKLTSGRCLVDARWVLKIDGFGLDCFRDTITIEKDGEYAYYFEMLWTAPELLRMKHRPANGTQKGDVYSFAIIAQEIAFRTLPFFMDEEDDPKPIVESVRDPTPPPYRPTPQSFSETEVTEVNPILMTLMQKCWSEGPTDRPTFDDIIRHLRKLNDGKKFNIVDNMIQKLEKYANNLEGLVQQRTSDLTEEKRKTDKLLYQLLPSYVAEELKAGRQVEPRMYASVTIYFSDIVGFTTLSSSSTPFEVVNLLNDLYTVFDDTITHYDVYKVETIGDAYMVVSGLPQPNGGKHICEICNTALELRTEILKFKIRHRPDESLRLRIGIHTGPCAAGVVGQTMPRYCLFGDTVNVASRMESTGEAMRIHLSEPAASALSAFGGYVTEPRDAVNGTMIKGKGLMQTYWLLERAKPGADAAGKLST